MATQVVFARVWISSPDPFPGSCDHAVRHTRGYGALF
jgi:hypothetical protein